MRGSGRRTKKRLARKRKEREMKEETRQTGKCEGIESPRRDLYTLYSRNPSRISPRSLLALSAEACGGVGTRERRDSTMRARIARHCRPPRSSLIPPLLPGIPFVDASSEATEILEALFVSSFSSVWKFQHARRYQSRAKGSLKMFRKRCTARIIRD